ncbi:MAG: Dabb family protein [Myxococcaceae bacterium]|jgi:hypothetical protein|nr:Dabb family protein [Myxococcaceae bacterium]
MFRHIVLVRFKPEATDAQKQAVHDALDAFSHQIPEVRTVCIGNDVGRKGNSWDFAAVLDFNNREAFARYLVSPAHIAYAEGPGKAAVDQLAVVQHDW